MLIKFLKCLCIVTVRDGLVFASKLFINTEAVVTVHTHPSLTVSRFVTNGSLCRSISVSGTPSKPNLLYQSLQKKPSLGDKLQGAPSLSSVLSVHATPTCHSALPSAAFLIGQFLCVSCLPFIIPWPALGFPGSPSQACNQYLPKRSFFQFRNPPSIQPQDTTSVRHRIWMFT